MTLPRRIPTRARRDATEPLIIATLERVGAVVVPLSAKDLPDLLVGHRGVWRLLECKAGRRLMSPGQVAFFERARLNRLPVSVVRTPEEALAAIGIATRRGRP